MKATRRIFSAVFALIFLFTTAFGEALTLIEAPLPEGVPQYVVEPGAVEKPEAPEEELIEEEALEPAAGDVLETTEIPEIIEEIPAAEAPAEEAPAEEPAASNPPVELEEIIIEEFASEPTAEAPELFAESAEALPLDAAPDGFEISGTTLTKYSGSDSDITIPEGVTKIGDGAFERCASLRSVTIPEYVTSIGSYAFRNCTNLETVTMTDSISGYDLNIYAFMGCTNLRNVTLSNNIVWMSSVFSNCSSLEQINLPAKLKYIGGSFSGCSSLQSIVIPSGVTEIDSSSFSGCTNLNSVTFEGEITSIGSSAFKNCSSLTAIDIQDSVTKIQSSAFEGCSGLQSIQLPDGLIELGESCFKGCSGLTTVRVPDRIAAIKYNTFQNCTHLQTVELPAKLESIGSSAFSGCAALESIDLHEVLTSIGTNAFNGCAALESVTIPASVTSFGKDGSYYYSVFQGCAGLREVTFNCALEEIPRECFKDCANLQTVTINGAVQSIGDSAFENCDSLASVDFIDGVTTIGSAAFRNCDGLREARIPGSVTHIGRDRGSNDIFSNCKNLRSLTIESGEGALHVDGTICSGSPLETLVIARDMVNENYDSEPPSGGILVNERLFYELKSLTDVTITEAVTSLPQSCFYNCGFTDIVLPSSLTSISEKAFYHCNLLRTIEIPAQVARIGMGAFYDCDRLWKVDLPGNLTEIGDYAFASCEALENIQLHQGLSRIGSHAFDSCGALTSLELPASLQSFGEYAFANSAVSSFDVPSGVTEIPEGAFSSLNYWSSDRQLRVTLPATLTTIGPKAFEESALKSIEIPGSVTSIGSRAFAESNLRSVLLPVGVTTIEREVFDGCAQLTNITVPGTVTEIKSYAFQNCRNLTTAVLEEGVTKLGDGAFKDCAFLRTIQLPESLTSIDRYAFDNCDKLTAFVVSGSKAESYCIQNNIPYNTDSIEDIEFTGVKDGDAVPAGDGYVLRWNAVPGADLYVAGRRYLNEGYSESSWENVEFEELASPAYTLYMEDTELEFWISAYKTSGSGRTLLAEGKITLHGDWNISSVTFPATLRLGVGESTTVKATSNRDSKFTYASSKPKVATITSGGKVTALKAGTTTLTARGNNSGESASCVLTVYAVPTKVSLSPSKLSIGVGQTSRLAATPTPASAETTLTYASSDDGIARVDDEGIVTGMGAGTATVTVKTDNGKSASCTVTVKPAPDSVSFDPAELTITVGHGATLKPILDPANSAASFTFESDDDTVAIVDESGNLEAVGVGDATITATTQNGKQGAVTVHALAAPKAIEGVPEELELGVGEKLQLKPSAGENTDITFSYASKKAAVATVSAKGKITARKAGEAVVTVTPDAGEPVKCNVTVVNAPSKVTLNLTKATLGVGDELRLSAKLPNGSASAITFSCNKKGKVVTLGEDGLITAVGTGIATITATTFNGKTASCTVTVREAPDSVSFDPAGLTLAEGQSFQLAPRLDAGSAASFTYESEAEDIADVSEAGLLTAVKRGSADITVTTYNGKSARCRVTVVPGPTNLSIEDITLGVGEKLELKPTLDSGADSDVCPFTYAVKKAAIASVSASGMITGKAVGTTTLTVKTYNGKSATCNVTVKAAPKKNSLSFSIRGVTMSPGGKLRLDAVLSGDAASKLSYSSSNPAVATVAEDGTVTAVAPGTATITATTFNDRSASFTLTVE